MTFIVTFRDKYAEYDGPEDEDLLDSSQSFATMAEAEAFIDGLTYGDEPQYVVVDRSWPMPPVMHLPVELVGGSIPAHVPGAYPRLSCCGGPKLVVPATEA